MPGWLGGAKAPMIWVGGGAVNAGREILALAEKIGASVVSFRTGKGVAWGEHHDRLYCGVAAFYRNAYRASLLSEWLPALDGVVERLEAGIAVADVGCGHGHSTLLMAEAFPRSRFNGFDAHPESIEAARRNGADAGLAARVVFEVARAVDYPGRNYGLICFFDCLHDLGDPLGAARHAHETLAAEGTVLIVEPMAGERVEDNLNPLGRAIAGGSTLLCLPHSRATGGPALGALASEARLRDVVTAGGFGRFRRATETPFNRVFEARR